MWPPLWGSQFHFLIHSGSLSFPQDDVRLNDTILHQLQYFFNHLGYYLTCPGCTMSFVGELAQYPPNFVTGKQFWKYYVDLHNSINKRIKRRTFDYAEALQALSNRLEPFKLDHNTINRAFLFDYWVVVFLISAVRMSEKKSESTENEMDNFRKFMHSVTYIFPFQHAEADLGDGENKTVGDKMRLFINDTEKFNLTTSDRAFESLVNMYNDVCIHFDVIPMSVKQAKQKFENEFSNTNTTKLIRADQIRQEDHVKIEQLQNEMLELRNHKDEHSGSPFNPIILFCVLYALLFILLSAYILKQYRIFGWRMVYKDSTERYSSGRQTLKKLDKK
jgi:hypothetical protein